MHFEWDPNKTQNNQAKHKVSFSEAMTVFFDEHALQIPDPDNSMTEDRFIMLGLSRNLRELVVCHCYTENEDTIRLISARKADKQESSKYWSLR
jgi:uncharacterized DUF497 family protein